MLHALSALMYKVHAEQCKLLCKSPYKYRSRNQSPLSLACALYTLGSLFHKRCSRYLDVAMTYASRWYPGASWKGGFNAHCHSPTRRTSETLCHSPNVAPPGVTLSNILLLPVASCHLSLHNSTPACISAIHPSILSSLCSSPFCPSSYLRYLL